MLSTSVMSTKANLSGQPYKSLIRKGRKGFGLQKMTIDPTNST